MSNPNSLRSLVVTTRERTALARTYFNRHVWKPALDAAGVPAIRANGMHALRHTYASVLLEDGVSIKALAEYLGHSSEDRARVAVDRAFATGGLLEGGKNVRESGG
jgi:site-specific recombinase XerD